MPHTEPEPDRETDAGPLPTLPTLPTVELHRHFEAGLRPETIARLAARHGLTTARTRAGEVIPGVDPQDPDSVRRYYAGIAEGFRQPDGFARFTDSFGLPLSLIRSLEDLEEAVFDQLVVCAEEGSLHTELRGSPFTYQEHVHAPVEEIATALVRGVERAWIERGVSGTFILAFSRQKGIAGPEAPPERRQAASVARLAAALHRADRPVGLDIAGFPETTFPPGLFEEALRPAREAGVPLTVHAGEQGRPPDFADAPPGLIVEAVERLGARRIGHGTSLAASRQTRALVRDRGVSVECCPVSNERMGFMPVATHPLPLFLEEGLLASVCTDDPLMFGPFSVSETLSVIGDPLGLDRAALLQLSRNGVQSAFVSDARRRVLLNRLEDAAGAGHTIRPATPDNAPVHP
jgi:adenosine deaminase